MRAAIPAALALAAITLLWSTPEVRSQAGLRYTLDSFENGIRIVEPNATRDDQKYLWSLYSGTGSGVTDLTSVVKHEGSQSLHSQYLGGRNWQFQLFTYTYDLPGFNNDWQFMRKFVKDPEQYTTGRVNRMRFWIKLPPGLTQSTYGNHNFEFGTYIRCSTCTGAEGGGGHFYHMVDFASTGEWEQVIIDTHPDHSRGDDANAERPDRLYATGERGFTYFDGMTRFYLDFPYQSFALPADFHMDGFELYEETRTENVDQIRSIHAVYVPATNQVQVGWRRRKDEDLVKHEVRYAFSDIHALGWNAATAAPNGTIMPPGTAGYNGMIWSTTALSLSGKSQLYVAIRPQNSSLFRQVVIPLTQAASPAPPLNVRIVS